MQANVQALQDLAADSGENSDATATLARFDEIGRILTGKDTANASDGVAWVGELCLALGLPGLRKHGLSTVDFPLVVERARKASSMQGNPVKLSDEALTAILTRAIG